MEASTTRGQRFYLVRLACGDGVRRAESMRAFVARVERETGLVIHPSVLSEIENDKASKTVTLEQIAAVAAVDPKHRGKLWLAWDEPEQGAITDEEIERLRAERDAAVAESERLLATAGDRRRPARRPKPK